MKLDLYFVLLIACLSSINDMEALVLSLNSVRVPPARAVKITFC